MCGRNLNGNPVEVIMNADAHKRRDTILFSCFFSILFAVVWPFIYPGLDYVLALVGFGSSPGLFKAIKEFGPIYGKLSTTAPGFFKGMAEASQQLSGEHPALASLPYMVKAELLLYICIPVYAAEVLVFMVVGFISFASRLFPWKKMKTIVQAAAIVVSVLPLIAVCLWCIIFIGIAYIQAWSASLLDFLFLIVLFPAVFAKVVSPSMGIFVLGNFLIPSGLALAGEGSLGDGLYKSMIENFFT
jgi:hypothetical protein